MVGSEQQSKNSGLPCIVQDGEGGEEGPVWSVPKLPIPAPRTDQLVRLAQKFLSLGVATGQWLHGAAPLYLLLGHQVSPLPRPGGQPLEGEQAIQESSLHPVQWVAADRQCPLSAPPHSPSQCWAARTDCRGPRHGPHLHTRNLSIWNSSQYILYIGLHTFWLVFYFHEFQAPLRWLVHSSAVKQAQL